MTQLSELGCVKQTFAQWTCVTRAVVCLANPEIMTFKWLVEISLKRRKSKNEAAKGNTKVQIRILIVGDKDLLETPNVDFNNYHDV